MDQKKRDRLSELVEELTTSGEPQLNQVKMKEVKKICKLSSDYINHYYHLIMTQLNQDHAEIRLSAFQMATELFSRSHHFRVLLVTNLQEFLELTVETDVEQPLPPPKEVARKLKTHAIQTVQAWQATYGEAYKKLALGYHFLKQVKKVDFQDVEARTLAERKRQEEKRQRLEKIYNEKFEKAKQEMEGICCEAQEMAAEMEESLTQMNSCMALLVPDTFDLFSVEPTVGSERLTFYSGPERDASIWDEQPCCSKDLSRGADGRMTEATKDEEDEDSAVEEDDTDAADKVTFIRNTGLMSHSYRLDLSISTDLKVKETEENEAVLNTMRDLHRLITTRYLPMVQSWIQIFTKVGVEEQLMRQAISLKKALEKALRKHRDLNVDYKKRQRKVIKAGDDDDDDDDFEEVPEKEGYEPHIPEHLRPEYGLDPLPSTSTSVAKSNPSEPLVRAVAPPVASTLTRLKKKLRDEEQDPTSAAATLRILKERLSSAPSTSKPICNVGQDQEEKNDCMGVSKDAAAPTVSRSEQTEEKEKAPIIPFGVDLYYWGEEQPIAGKIIKYTSQHQFWVPHEVEEEVENEDLSAQMKSRHITFAGCFQPVEHKCKALMPNGSLCERQDRVKCPFHGLIIPRDELGRPVNLEDAARLGKEEMKRREEQPDWWDPEFMKEIEAATGEDLGSSKTYGKGKGKKRKHHNLTDLKQTTNTSRLRLEKKVFNKSSMRRIAEVMNKMDKKKHEKFANQFNYALK
ncbi:UV-stimulated scaffold protein A isoform X1 [Electrophorus electricus]|uniref:UV-stimulated scaffold protein A isoform X1 n=1 Tax=Electrophorus electricus TaxID=8005 RepID=UPI0015CFAD77|nr:UV-stimulated scaffold protein A isoform X1 [Electrophorus electricus]XP_026864452.2 UV-stimulated scaffold protein A isoform X1 [Electrophorus electricus]XP_026864453.2 UV-stimulated scaffold protein A isoform X1 [Electrophorus electricus]XP_026864454.2 UV-stimulated scaffold protein A isoform X1 [Electrophorus electricus]